MGVIDNNIFCFMIFVVNKIVFFSYFGGFRIWNFGKFWWVYIIDWKW